MPEPSFIISIVALIGSVMTGFFTIAGKVKKSDCYNCTCETRGEDDVIIQALDNQNEVILTQIRNSSDSS